MAFGDVSGEYLLLPEAKAYYETMSSASMKGYTDRIPDMRKDSDSINFYGPLQQDGLSRVYDKQANGPAGLVPLKIYEPEGHVGTLPIIVYFHGGGWVTGNNFANAAVAARYAVAVGAVVLAVEYRLAPENPFPAAVEDCWAAVLWAAANAGQIRGDASRVAVVGESAGGNLAAVMSLMAKEQGQTNLIKAQVLMCAVTDLHGFDSPSYTEFASDRYDGKMVIKWFDQQYSGEADRKDPHLSPLFAVNLSGLPPAFVGTAEVDVLRDESEQYAKRLEEAGVTPVLLKRYRGHFHSSMLSTKLFPPHSSYDARDTYKDIANFLAKVWG